MAHEAVQRAYCKRFCYQCAICVIVILTQLIAFAPAISYQYDAFHFRMKYQLLGKLFRGATYNPIFYAEHECTFELLVDEINPAHRACPRPNVPVTFSSISNPSDHFFCQDIRKAVKFIKFPEYEVPDIPESTSFPSVSNNESPPQTSLQGQFLSIIQFQFKDGIFEFDTCLPPHIVNMAQNFTKALKGGASMPIHVPRFNNFFFEISHLLTMYALICILATLWLVLSNMNLRFTCLAIYAFATHIKYHISAETYVDAYLALVLFLTFLLGRVLEIWANRTLNRIDDSLRQEFRKYYACQIFTEHVYEHVEEYAKINWMNNLNSFKAFHIPAYLIVSLVDYISFYAKALKSKFM